MPAGARRVAGTIVGRIVDWVVLWFVATGFTVLLTLLASLRHRMRMSHNNGIGAVGRIRIAPDPAVPPHPFFAPGTVYPCRIRHASVSFLDDAMRAVRSISIKFADTRFRSPCDLELNSGTTALFWNAASFLRFAKYKRTRFGIQYPEYYKRYPSGVRGAMNSLRRNPVSFADQHYYSKTPLYYIGTDKVTRYAKYRVIPREDIAETGKLEGAELLIPPENQRTLPGETRSRNYLKDEYRARVAKEGARYCLQVQLHTARDDDSPEVFNCCAEWDEASHPWMDLAEIEIERTLSWRESCLLSFSLGNLPQGLHMVPARSIFDYNSLNYMRRRTELARRARVLACQVFGPPPEIPDDENRNQ